MNLTRLSSMEHMILDHPLFGMCKHFYALNYEQSYSSQFLSSINCFYISLGFKHTDKWKKLKKKDCEFCFLVVVGWNMTIPRPDPMNAIEPVDLGNFQVEYVLDMNKGRLYIDAI